MTRKDYKIIAKALQGTRPRDIRSGAYAASYGTWLATRRAIAAELMLDNPRFDSGKFYEATEQSALGLR